MLHPIATSPNGSTRAKHRRRAQYCQCHSTRRIFPDSTLKMVEVRTYSLPPTALVPNSPRPLLHYPGFLRAVDCKPEQVYDLFASNGWHTQWITRYGPTQESHYHSGAHECMAVLSGSATIRFGVADTVEDAEENTHGPGHESGGIEVKANVGDVFVLPAGLAHKTFDPSPAASFKQLLPGDGHFVDASDARGTVANAELSGFTMIGAYPEGCTWDFRKGGVSEAKYERVWSVPLPSNDPVLGQAPEGLHGVWAQSSLSAWQRNDPRV